MTEDNELVELSTLIKRGTGTRDEDRHEIRVVREDIGEAIAEFEQLKDLLREWAVDCRTIQPEAHIKIESDGEVIAEGDVTFGEETEIDDYIVSL